MTVVAVEASLVPRVLFADHLLSLVHDKAAAWAASSISWSNAANFTGFTGKITKNLNLMEILKEIQLTS